MKTPKSRSRKKAPVLPGMAGIDRPTVHWFSKNGCVVRQGEERVVLIAAQRVGSWEVGEGRIRNALMVQLAADPTIILEDLARAFEVTSETLRVQRRRFEAEGLKAVLTAPEPHHRGGRRIEPAVRRRMERMFKQGRSTAEVVASLQGKVKLGTVEKYRRLWKRKQAELPKPAHQTSLQFEPITAIAQEDRASTPQSGPAAPEPSPARERAPAAASNVVAATPASVGEAQQDDVALPPIRALKSETSERSARATSVATTTPPESVGVLAEIAEFAPFSAKGVQHVGAWLLLVTIASLGLYSHLVKHERRKSEGRPLRVAIDAVISVLAIGGRCVESVRRLATSTITAMILADSAPSASWVRRTLGSYCAGNVSEQILMAVSGELLNRAKERSTPGKPVVLFIDNHARPYTGMHELRRIWRMQGKCTVPGAMDYWVHDAEGRPVLVIPVETNASLPNTVREWVGFLREKLGKETPLLLAFDRAGAFPGLFKWLRDNGVQFVTYQRASYRKFRRDWFRRHGRPMTLCDANGKRAEVLVQAGRMNLGRERGRVRRLRILLPDDAQMNVVASSPESEEWLCQTLFSRWRQENAFKHAVERWGLNQLDGRQVEDVPDGTLVSNPRRVHLEKTLRETREQEKKLRLQLQRLYPGHPDRPKLTRALADNRAHQDDLIQARHWRPRKVPIEQTELCGELKQHTRDYKLLLDTMRCAAQNAEAELAAALAPHLALPREAKRLLQNVFSAPGDIRVTKDGITITLDPATNCSERDALNAFFSEFNQGRLSHPGDPFSRPVCFRLQIP